VHTALKNYAQIVSSFEETLAMVEKVNRDVHEVRRLFSFDGNENLLQLRFKASQLREVVNILDQVYPPPSPQSLPPSPPGASPFCLPPPPPPSPRQSLTAVPDEVDRLIDQKNFVGVHQDSNFRSFYSLGCATNRLRQPPR
jgi:hypothetical protein